MYPKSENSASFLDTIKQVLILNSTGITPQITDKLAHEIFINFKFFKKRKDNREKYLNRLKSLVDHYAEQIDADSRAKIITTQDTRYKIKSVKRKVDLSQITIFGDGIDSAQGTFKKFIGAKIKKIVSRGDEGGMLFLSEMLDQVPKVMFFLLPIFALILKLFYIRHRIVYINHLIFALHLHTIFFIYILIPVIFTNGYVVLAMLIALWLHIFFSFKNVYGQSIIKTFIKMNTIMLIYTFVVFAGVLLLLFLTLLYI